MFHNLVVLRIEYLNSLIDRLLVIVRPLGDGSASEKPLLQSVVRYIEEED